MKKLNQNGVTPVTIIVIAVVVALSAAVGVYTLKRSSAASNNTEPLPGTTAKVKKFKL